MELHSITQGRGLSLIAALFTALTAAACDGAKAHNGTGGDAGAAGMAGTGGSAGDAGSGGAPQTSCDRGAAGDSCGGYAYTNFGLHVDPIHMRQMTTAAISVHLWSLFTIREPVLGAVRDGAILTRIDDGSDIAFSTTWLSTITDAAHEADLTITPSDPLDDGWYLLSFRGVPVNTPQSSVVSLAHLEGDLSVSMFYVGSAPTVALIVREADSLAVTFSEPVVLPDPLPIALRVAGETVACTPTPAGSNETRYVTSTLTFSCPIETTVALDVVVSEGVMSSSDAPLRNLAGDTEFVITLDSLAATTGTRRWNITDALPR